MLALMRLLLAPALPLDEHDVGILPVIAANPRLDVVRALELDAVRPVDEMFRIVGVGRVSWRFPAAAVHERADPERGVVIEAKVLELAAELAGEVVEQESQPRAEPGGEISSKRFLRVQLPLGDLATDRERNVRAMKARHQRASNFSMRWRIHPMSFTHIELPSAR